MKKMKLGISTFAEVDKDPTTNKYHNYDLRINQVIEEIVLAEKVGLDFYGIGEHHREDFAASAPAIILAAAAKLTHTITLSSAVTVLSSDDPVRVYQQFATLNALSHGRAEIMAGRGSFIESFPLFGYDLKDYDALFEEKLALLVQIRDTGRATYHGKYRGPLRDQPIYPKTDFPLPIHVAVGGTLGSVIRAAKNGLPLILAIIGGDPMQFKVLVDVYKRKFIEYGHDEASMMISVHSHGYIDLDDEKAAKDYFPSIQAMMTKIGIERGFGPYTEENYRFGLSEQGALFVGSPKTVAKKILRLHEGLGIDRFVLHVPVGPLDHEKVLRTIEYFGVHVKPLLA